jgi:hypothetical protein
MATTVSAAATHAPDLFRIAESFERAAVTGRTVFRYYAKSMNVWHIHEARHDRFHARDPNSLNIELVGEAK